MENKIILITGANGGVGSAFVKRILALKPQKIYCAARDVNSLKDIKSLSEVIEVLSLDLTENASIKHVVSKIGKIDILINNAGVNTNSRLFDPHFLDLEVNLKGTVNLTQALFEKLKESKGKVINITSILALANFPMLANYSVSKAALHSFTQALRAEFNLFGGEVYEVLPGPIETRMTEGMPIPKSTPEEIVDVVIESVDKKEYEIYPDDFSQKVKQRLQSEPDALIKEFGMSISSLA
jgi:short-subunit dehydrogenase